MLSCLCAFAQAEVVFDFSKSYNVEASSILNEYVQQFTRIYCPEARAIFYDIDNDSKKEIVGYAKNGSFYNLKGYRLLILKEAADDDEINTITIDDKKWKMVPSDVYFEPDLPLTIDGDKVTFKHAHFYNNKKQSAKILVDTLKTRQDFGAIDSNRARKIAETIEFTNNNLNNSININEFNGAIQRQVKIYYNRPNPQSQPKFREETTFPNIPL